MSLNCDHERAYSSSSRWYMGMQSHSTIILTALNWITRTKTCPSVTLSTNKPHKDLFLSEGGVGLVPKRGCLLRIPQMTSVWRATVEWYWQGKTEEVGEKPVPVPLCPSQIPHGLTRGRTLASAVRGRRLTTWAMAWPLTRTYPDTNQGRCSERPATNSLSTVKGCNLLNERYVKWFVFKQPCPRHTRRRFLWNLLGQSGTDAGFVPYTSICNFCHR
jgi:hypothetical protein